MTVVYKFNLANIILNEHTKRYFLSRLNELYPSKIVGTGSNQTLEITIDRGYSPQQQANEAFVMGIYVGQQLTLTR